MKYDIYFILNYWKIHRRKALLILLSYILMMVLVFSAFSMVRTELRRTYYDGFTSGNEGSIYITSSGGGYNFMYKGLSEEEAQNLASEEFVTQSARVYIDCYMGNEEFSYTYGAYENDLAYELSGIRLKAGAFPQKSGETAISELALSNMRIDAKVGDTITLSKYDGERNYTEENEYLLTGIFEDDGTRDGWETRSADSMSLCEPVILLSLDDMDLSTAVLSVMIREKYGDRLSAYYVSLTEEEQEEELSKLESYLKEAEYGGRGGNYDSSYFAYVMGLDEYSDGNIKTEKSNFYTYTCFAASIVMMISLLCTLLVILPQKLRSMKIMYKTGYPIWRLKRMMMLEWLMFTGAGLVLGFIFAVICYELLLQLQHGIFGLEVYRAWSGETEWGIKQITYSPELFSILSAVIASVISFLIPTLFLKKLMLSEKNKIKKQSSFSAVSYSRGMRKIFRQPLIKSLQIISLTVVIAVGCTSMMFFSTNGKSSSQNPQILAQGRIFETDLRLDMRRYDIDCTIVTPDKLTIAGLLDVSNMECGVSPAYTEKLSGSDKVSECYAWSSVNNLYGCYPKGSDAPKDIVLHNPDQFVPGEISWYGLDDYDIYNISTPLIMNDRMLEALGADLNALDSGKAAVISLSGGKKFEGVSSIPLFHAVGKPNHDMQFRFEITGSKFITAEIAQVVYLDEEMEKSNPLLYNIVNKVRSGYYIGNYIFAFSSKGAEKLGLFNKNFDNIYIRYADGTRDSDIRNILSGVNFSKSNLEITTITQQQKNYDTAMLKENVVVYTIFLFFFLIALIGYIQTLKLQIGQKKAQISVLRAIGASGQKLTRSITYQLMKIPLLSCGIGGAVTLLLRAFFKHRYDICQELYEIAENEHAKTDLYLSVMRQFREQSALFFTEYEMWKVSVVGTFAILSVIILAVIFLSLWRISKKAVKSNSILEEGE